MNAKTLLKIGSPIGLALLALAAAKGMKKGNKSKETARTGAITSQLKQAGLTDKEIAKLKGKMK